MGEDGAEDALQEAAWEVYGVPPAEFVATRTRWVKQLRSQKQREVATSVAALRKPSVSAAAINALVRAGDPVVGRLGDVGTRMRHAQSALDAQGLAALRTERDAVLRDWVAAAELHASGPLTSSAADEVRDTAVAALADAAATEAVLSGTLTRALSYSGFGEVDVSDAVARTSTGVVLTRIDGGGEDDTTEPDPDDTETQSEPDDTAAEPDPDDSAAEPDPDDSEAEAVPDDTEAELALLEESLARAEEQVKALRQARRSAAQEMETAVARVTEAEAALTEAAELLARAEEAADKARAAELAAREALTDVDNVLAEARTLRDEARTALEQAEDAGGR